jgi:hypothetical protein
LRARRGPTEIDLSPRECAILGLLHERAVKSSIAIPC